MLDAVFAWFDRVDALFSTWRDDSEIARLASGELDLGDATDDVRCVLHQCESLRIDTDGAFDVSATALLPPPHPPGWCALDPSGFVKGWALDRAADLLAERGVRRCCINAGGDVVVRGDHPWRVGIQHPWKRDELAAVVAVAHGGIATSGRYERGNHVVDPRTGAPAFGLASVTVIAAELAIADAHATAALALGQDGIDWLRDRGDVDAMAITDEGRLFTTPGFERFRAPL